MTNNRNVEAVVRATLRNEWPKFPIPDLIQYSYMIMGEKKEIIFMATFNDAVPEIAEELLWEIEGILSTHLDDDWMVSTEFLQVSGEPRSTVGEQSWFPFAGEGAET